MGESPTKKTTKKKTPKKKTSATPSASIGIIMGLQYSILLYRIMLDR